MTTTETLVCLAPVAHGPRKGTTAQGSWAGYNRHSRAGQEPCRPCKEAANARNRSYRAAEAKPKPPKRNREYGEATGGQTITASGSRYKIVGPQYVYCTNCGAKGTANRAIVGRKRALNHCANCKERTT